MVAILSTDTMNLIGTFMEIVVLALLLTAVYESRVRRRPRNHWKIMAAAVVLNLLTVVFLMVPVFIALAPGISGGFLGPRGTVDLVHHGLGLIGLALSIYVMGSFLANGKDMKRCPTTRKSTHRLMQVTYVFLLLPLVIGLFLRFVPF
jgi:chromate transport protein ChrA